VIGLLGMLFLFLFANELTKLLAVPPNMHDEARILFYLTGTGFFAAFLNSGEGSI